MLLSEQFDAVVMLTWSDWKTEPRSNRYHYATRFAKSVPVLFLQHCYQYREDVLVEPSGHPNIDLVHVSCGVTTKEIHQIKALLRARGIKRPLLWLYDSLHYDELIEAIPQGLLLYHATEDYLTPSAGWNQDMEILANSLVTRLKRTDYMVACASGVAKSYVEQGGYKGPYAVIENGCDAAYFIDRAQQYPAWQVGTRPVALFQGGLNKRVDYQLLIDLAQSMPDWEFRFCGAAQPNPDWTRLSELPNVTYLGVLDPEGVAQQMYAATVGLIPYIQDQWIKNSYPLKAYEYVSCGLPVVSVPVSCLEREPELFAIATTAAEFRTAILARTPGRHDPDLMAKRRAAAHANSYDGRYEQMLSHLLPATVALRQERRRLRIAVLYDSTSSMHVNTIAEHLEAFDKYSHHEITYLPATIDYWKQTSPKILAAIDLNLFDVAIVHYSVRMSVRTHLDEGMARALERFHGLKALFIQDEYEGTEIARAWMDRLHFDIVYTCVPDEGIETVYPSYRYPTTEFLPTLTGYVPERRGLESFGKPLAERKLSIAYRGRALDPVYGQLGQEKYRIGVEMKAIAEARQLPVDIEVDDSRRIYGDAWYEFLGSARATLGTESGANVFDYDGLLRKEIRQLKAANPNITFEAISEQVLAGHEGLVKMNQISPKIFEAIRLRTVLILFEGEYSGVVTPDEHFIALKKDFSNIDDVLAKLADDDFVAALTTRAYNDIVASQRYSYRAFVEAIDRDLESRVLRHKEAWKVLQATFYADHNGTVRLALPLMPPPSLWVGPHPLPNSPAVGLLPVPVEYVPPPGISSDITSTLPFRIARRAWRALPVGVRTKLYDPARSTAEFSYRVGRKLARWTWTRLPGGAKRHLRKILGR